MIDLNNGGGPSPNHSHLGNFTNFTDLTTQFPTTDVGDLAFVENSQGTFWLPGSFLGTFYSKGLYVWNGSDWVSSVDEIAQELDKLSAAKKLSLIGASTGVTKYDGLTVNGGDNTKINIGAIEGWVLDSLTNPADPDQPIQVSEAATIGYTPTTPVPGGDTVVAIFLSIDSVGTIFESVTPPSVEDLTEKLDAGIAIKNNLGVILFTVPRVSNFIQNIITQFIALKKAIGSFNLSGNVVTLNNDLTFDISGGEMFENGASAVANPKNPDYVEQDEDLVASFNVKLSDGTDVTLGETEIDTTIWDNGTSTPGIVPNNKVTARRVGRFADSGSVETLLGQEIFDSVVDAENAITRLERNFVIPADSADSVALYWLITKKGITDLLGGLGTTVSLIPASRFGGGGGGGSKPSWQPPQGNLGLGATSGVSLFRATGGGLQYAFDGASDDEISENILLKNNGIAYDGSSLTITIFYQLSANAGATDDAVIDLDLQFVTLGDDTDAAPSTVTESIVLDNKVSGQVYGFTFAANFTGTAGDKLLMFSSLTNNTGVGQGSYAGEVWQLGYEINKV